MTREDQENNPDKEFWDDEVIGFSRGPGDPDIFGYPGEENDDNS